MKYLYIVLAFIGGMIFLKTLDIFDKKDCEEDKVQTTIDFLLSDAQLGWVSDECAKVMSWIKDETLLQSNNWNNHVVPKGLLLMGPSMIYKETDELVMIFSSRRPTASIKWRKDGSLWLYGDSARRGPIQIFPK